MLGMWTVTWQLHPTVVMLHLVGGMGISSLLWWSYLHTQGLNSKSKPKANISKLILIALGVLGAQIIIGGWTSANYAALACPDFPRCQGSWWPRMNFTQGFSIPFSANPHNYAGGSMDMPARTAIAFAHRIGALICLIYLGGLTHYLAKRMPRSKPLIRTTAALLLAQISLGIINVTWQLPLLTALLHNLTALLMILCLATLYQQSKNSPPLPQDNEPAT